MSITSALVLYAVIWFIVFFVAIPIRLKTQGDLGDVVPGTQAGAPEDHQLRKKAWITTGVTFVIWGISCAIIISEKVTMQDIDLFNRM